jgi:hypothetical protein
MEVSGQLRAPTILFPTEERPKPLGQEAGMSPQPIWTFRRKSKSIAAARESKIDFSVVQL